MGWDEGVAKDAVFWMPDTETTTCLRYLEVARPGAFITSTNKNVEATMRWLDAMLETEMMFSLYYGEQDATDGTGWTYNENGKIIDNHTLTALTLLVAESNPKEKEIMIDLIMNFLAE